MTTLSDFLLARIAEDEAAAREWYSTGTVDQRRDDFWLAECEAKRRIVSEHGGQPPYHVDPCDAHDAAGATIPCDTLRALASVYADHPDYRPEWAL